MDSNMYYVGLDLGLRTSSLHVLDANGKLFKARAVKGAWDKVVDAVAALARPLKVCFEASCGYGHVYDRLAPLAEAVEPQPGDVGVARPGRRELGAEGDERQHRQTL